MKKVVKFGGSSLASAEQFKKVGNIIRAEESRRYVVPSAPGKRFSADTKVTDMLYGCYAAAENGEDFTEKLAAIKDRYQEIIDGLGLKFSLDEDFEVIRKNFSEKAGSNYAASRGEFLNGRLWLHILDLNLLMQQRLFVLMRMEISSPRSQMKLCLHDLKRLRMLLSRDSTEQQRKDV